MGHALRPGLHFCLAGDRPLFLDVTADRYFCLGGEADRAFRALIAPARDDPADAALLLDAGILVPHIDTITPSPARSMPLTGMTMLDRVAAPRALQTVRACADIVRTDLRLRRRGFAVLLGAFERRKRRATDTSEADARLLAALSGFVATRLLFAEHDRCLVRSFAIGERLLRLGVRPDVVVGVKLQPFKAHCWVQLGGTLVNDRPDIVREFTPIVSL